MFAWLVLIAVVHSAEPSVALHVPVDAPCRLSATLPDALSVQGISLSRAGWQLGVRASAPALELSLRDAGGALRGWRTLQVHDEDCPLVPQAIATLVRSWLDRSLETAVAPVTPVAPPPPPPPAAPPLLRASDALEEAVVDDEIQPAHARQLTADDVDLSAPPDLAEPAWVPQVDDEAIDEADALQHPGVLDVPRHTGSVMLLGGGAVAPSDSGVVQGSLGAEWGAIEPWGVQVEGGIQSYRSGRTVLGALNAQLSWAGAALRRAFYVWGRSGFVGSIGARLERIAVGIDGSQAGPRSVFTGSAVAALEWRQNIKAGFFFAARTFAEIRLRTETFSTHDTANAVTIPPFGMGMSAGVGWTFF